MRNLFVSALLAACALFQAQAQFTAPKEDYLQHIVTVDHPDRVYKVGESPKIRIEAYGGGIPVDGVKVAYSCADEMFLPALTDTVVFRDGVATIDMGPMDRPGFRECDLTFKVGRKTVKNVVKVAFDPHKIKTFTKMPRDFKKFWDAELKKAEAVPLDPQITLLDYRSDDKVSTYLVRLTVGEGNRFFYGYLSKPNDGKKHPAMFCPPGAGPFKRWPRGEYAKEGFIVFSTDIHGLSPELSDKYFKDIQDDYAGYWGRGITSCDSCYYRQVYAGCSRCIDFLASLPDWDGENIVCLDGSQGGALSIVSAALNPKVTFICPSYPALCDLEGFAHDRAGGWPKYFRNVEVADSDRQAVLETLPYYDVVNFARTLTQPGFYLFGYNDNTCSPTSVSAMLNEVKAPKTIYTTYTNSHYNFKENLDVALEWVRSMVFGNDDDDTDKDSAK